MNPTTTTFRAMLARQPVVAAPMCGISDFAYRELCRQMGAELTYTQMISSAGLAHNDRKTVSILDLEPGEGPVVVQIFGGNPDAMAQAGSRIQALGASVIDINMGCPARKITIGQAGASLLRDLPRVERIFRAMRAAVTVPLTVKMRWGWGEACEAALEVARMAEAEGLDGVCLHARTRQQGYSGLANWEQIARIKETVSQIPVIGNGDIRQPADALAMMRSSGCDAVMIGRAVIGDPWLLGEALAAVRSGQAPAHREGPDWPERRRVMVLHASIMECRHGGRGLIAFRKHAVAYLRGVRGSKPLRQQLMTVTTLDQLTQVLGEFEPSSVPEMDAS